METRGRGEKRERERKGIAEMPLDIEEREISL